MLATRSRGRGTAWITLQLQYEKDVANLQNTHDGVRQGVLIPTAYCTGDTFRPAPRAHLNTVLHLNRW